MVSHYVPTADRSPSNRVGKYALYETLGEGAFGKVKLAMDTHDPGQAHFAIKIMEKTHIEEHGLTLQVRREIAIMKAMRHPNIVNLHEVLNSTKKLYMVMDLVTGGELFDAVAAVGRLAEAVARSYFQQLIDGIAYCHERRVYHRDLKPENLLLSGDRKVLKITDFGLASIKEVGAKSELLHTVMGSPHYIAPEIITNAKQGYDGSKVDIWACGIILYGMMAGALPFDEDGTKALYKAIVNTSPLFPKHFSYDAIKLLRAMLHKDPSKRASMEEIKTYPWFKVDYFPAVPMIQVFSDEHQKERKETRRLKNISGGGGGTSGRESVLGDRAKKTKWKAKKSLAHLAASSSNSSITQNSNKSQKSTTNASNLATKETPGSTASPSFHAPPIVRGLHRAGALSSTSESWAEVTSAGQDFELDQAPAVVLDHFSGPVSNPKALSPAKQSYISGSRDRDVTAARRISNAHHQPLFPRTNSSTLSDPHANASPAGTGEREVSDRHDAQNRHGGVLHNRAGKTIKGMRMRVTQRKNSTSSDNQSSTSESGSSKADMQKSSSKNTLGHKLAPKMPSRKQPLRVYSLTKSGSRRADESKAPALVQGPGPVQVQDVCEERSSFAEKKTKLGRLSEIPRLNVALEYKPLVVGSGKNKNGVSTAVGGRKSNDPGASSRQAPVVHLQNSTSSDLNEKLQPFPIRRLAANRGASSFDTSTSHAPRSRVDEDTAISAPQNVKLFRSTFQDRSQREAINIDTSPRSLTSTNFPGTAARSESTQEHHRRISSQLEGLPSFGRERSDVSLGDIITPLPLTRKASGPTIGDAMFFAFSADEQQWKQPNNYPPTLLSFAALKALEKEETEMSKEDMMSPVTPQVKHAANNGKNTFTSPRAPRGTSHASNVKPKKQKSQLFKPLQKSESLYDLVNEDEKEKGGRLRSRQEKETTSEEDETEEEHIVIEATLIEEEVDVDGGMRMDREAPLLGETLGDSINDLILGEEMDAITRVQSMAPVDEATEMALRAAGILNDDEDEEVEEYHHEEDQGEYESDEGDEDKEESGEDHGAGGKRTTGVPQSVLEAVFKDDHDNGYPPWYSLDINVFEDFPEEEVGCQQTILRTLESNSSKRHARMVGFLDCALGKPLAVEPIVEATGPYGDAYTAPRTKAASTIFRQLKPRIVRNLPSSDTTADSRAL